MAFLRFSIWMMGFVLIVLGFTALTFIVGKIGFAATLMAWAGGSLVVGLMLMKMKLSIKKWQFIMAIVLWWVVLISGTIGVFEDWVSKKMGVAPVGE